VNEVATSKLFRRQTNCMRDFVHVPLEREDALRRAEAPERAVRRNIRRHRAAVNANVRANVWTSGMNRSA
jgi:pyrrolidone-carboxylate peptidase